MAVSTRNPQRRPCRGHGCNSARTALQNKADVADSKQRRLLPQAARLPAARTVLQLPISSTVHAAWTARQPYIARRTLLPPISIWIALQGRRCSLSLTLRGWHCSLSLTSQECCCSLSLTLQGRRRCSLSLTLQGWRCSLSPTLRGRRCSLSVSQLRESLDDNEDDAVTVTHEAPRPRAAPSGLSVTRCARDVRHAAQRALRRYDDKGRFVVLSDPRST